MIIGQLAVAFIFGSLAARIPVTGYSYQWMSRLANPVLGWIIGWVSFSFLAVVVVAVDYTIASTVMPVLLGYEGTALNAWVITGVVIMCQALLVGFSTKWDRAGQQLRRDGGADRHDRPRPAAADRGWIRRQGSQLRQPVQHRRLSRPRATSAWGTLTSAGPWMLGFLLGAFTIVGFESAANLAEETKDPARVVPRAMWQAVLSPPVCSASCSWSPSHCSPVTRSSWPSREPRSRT